MLSQNDYWKALGYTKNFSAFNALQTAKLAIRKFGNNQYKITNTGKIPAIAIKLNMVDASTRKIILPVYFSDGYFNLLHGESKLVSVNYSYKSKTLILPTGYNVK